MNEMSHPAEQYEPSMLTGGAFGLRSHRIQDSMTAYFTLNRTTFHEKRAWRLEQRSGPELLPFAVHHRRVRQAVKYTQQVAGLVRCVVVLEGRHRVVCPAKGMPEGAGRERRGTRRD
jgi:hypothetical protein